MNREVHYGDQTLIKFQDQNRFLQKVLTNHKAFKMHKKLVDMFEMTIMKII
jgi:hypothetical protein